jgi:signal transduction histidine kinase
MLDWTAQAPGGVPDTTWALAAWHASGSLERAVVGYRRRGLAVAFGLLALLVATGGAVIVVYRRDERAARDRAIVLAGISHELRTPLAVMQSAAENLRTGVVADPPAVAEYGQLIDDQTQRLRAIVERALVFARAVEIPTASREPHAVADAIAGALAGAPCPERVRVAHPVADLAFVGDAAAVATALRNLIENALAYSPSDGLVEISARRAGRAAIVEVADRGAGVPQGERARLFDPFARGSAGRASREHGLGLGLALASRIAAAQSGSLTYAPRPGGGSVFTLSLPAAP